MPEPMYRSMREDRSEREWALRHQQSARERRLLLYPPMQERESQALARADSCPTCGERSTESVQGPWAEWLLREARCSAGHYWAVDLSTWQPVFPLGYRMSRTTGEPIDPGPPEEAVGPGDRLAKWDSPPDPKGLPPTMGEGWRSAQSKRAMRLLQLALQEQQVTWERNRAAAQKFSDDLSDLSGFAVNQLIAESRMRYEQLVRAQEQVLHPYFTANAPPTVTGTLSVTNETA